MSAICTNIDICEGVKHLNNLMVVDTVLTTGISISNEDKRGSNVTIVQNKNLNVFLNKEALKMKKT